MADFIYEKPFPLQKDPTQYKLISKEHISTIDVAGREVLKVEPKALEMLAAEAMADVSFMLRTAHLEKVAKILEDPEATDNDRFVAHTLLKNAEIAAVGQLPSCQDTGTAIVMGKKGENVFTGVNDAEYLSKGVYNTYQERNLRYSQVVASNMFNEKNSGSNLPAQIDLYADQGDEYKFLFLTKGGGSEIKLIYINKQKHC